MHVTSNYKSCCQQLKVIFVWLVAMPTEPLDVIFLCLGHATERLCFNQSQWTEQILYTVSVDFIK